MKDIEERMRVAMRTAIRANRKAKLWAKVNCEDNFVLAVYGIADDAVMNIVVAEIGSPPMIDWFNSMNKIDEASKTVTGWGAAYRSNMKSFVLTTCREMYSVLRV